MIALDSGTITMIQGVGCSIWESSSFHASCRHFFPMPRRATTPPPHQQLPRLSSSARRGGLASVVPRAVVPLAPCSPHSAAAVPLAPPWLQVVAERRGGGGEGGAVQSAPSPPPSSRVDSARRETEGRQGRERKGTAAKEGEEEGRVVGKRREGRRGERGGDRRERAGSRRLV
jgi:hypothetical protein